MVDQKELSKSNILIVDDNPTNIVLLENVLEREGYTNYTSTVDPREVPALYDAEDFDLLLLDIRMPHINGIELMRMLHDRIQDDYIPILVLTAQTDQKTRQEALQAGAKDFLTKPFNFWEIILRIRNMLETRYYYKRQILRAETLEAEVRTRTRELYETQLEVVRRLGRAGEFRDNETGNHVIRMSKVSEIIARGMGLDEHTCELILNASPMHDVGKIAIPDSVLLKSGPLDPEEWEQMKTHVAVGAEILGDHPSEIIWTASQVALYHHEKWDGSGYPEGLRGENIPLVARIAAVSDVFDALTSERPYKKPWTMDAAVEYISSESGKHFDPQVVDAFIANLSKIVEVREAFPDS
ncbi:HD domain-containing phosphohydrolase [Maridesulfovibrio sp.]|uniref:HD domain-containing phosphohydrolase n=1 Tax=Maridesulfovibrio sp. TaxID=2795000 RepID=UPI002A1884B5|nr:HD domain-containing phosphohydrolase [Maridesulfovibrio sp.]